MHIPQLSRGAKSVSGNVTNLYLHSMYGPRYVQRASTIYTGDEPTPFVTIAVMPPRRHGYYAFQCIFPVTAKQEKPTK